MIVECPTCHTQYRVDDILVTGKDPVLQCSFDNCLFKLSSPPAARTYSIRGPLDKAQDRKSSGQEELGAKNPALSPEPLAPSHSVQDGPFGRPFGEPFNQTQGRPGLLTQKEPPLILSPKKRENLTSFSLRPFLVLLIALALFYGAFSLYLLAHPARTGSLLVRLPLIGRAFVVEQLSPRKINLLNLEGQYQLIRNNKRAFIISGRAVNTALVAAQSIQVEGKIFNEKGKEAGKKTIFCGNEVSIRVVENLSSQGISILQKLVPPKHFSVPPGKSANFLIIFINPPADIKEFSCRVVTVRS